MRADLLLEGEDLALLRIVRGVDHDVGDVREGVRTSYGVGGAGAEVGERPRARVVELVDRHLRAVRAQHEPAVLLAADQHESDAGVVGEGGQQRGVAAVDLLPAHPVRHVGEGDQAEVAGGQHDGLGAARGTVPLAALLDGSAQRGPHRRPRLGAAVGPLCLARHGQAAAGPDQVAEAEAVAGQEGLAGALAVVRQHHDPVGPRGVFGDLGHQGEGPVEALQDLLGVPAARPGVVGHLVVRHQVRVDRVAPGEHVADHRGDDDVPLDDGREGAHEGVQPAALDPGPPLLHPGPRGLAHLAQHLGDEGHGRTDGVGGVDEVGEVAGAGTVLPAPSRGHGQHQGQLVGAAAEEVAAAGAVDGEQASVAGVLDGPALEFGGAGGPVAHHDLVRVLLVPAEGRHVVVAAVQDAELAGAGLAGPVGAPRGEPVGGAAARPGAVEPLRDGGHQPLADRFPEHVVADAVELEEDGAGGRGPGPPVAAPAAPVGEPVEPAPVGVVVTDGEGASGGRGDRGHHGGDDHGGLGRGLALPGGVDAQGYEQQGPVQEEDEQTEHEGGHQEQCPYEQGPHERGEQTEDGRADPGRDGDPGGAVAVAGLQLEVGQHTGEDEHGDRGHGPHRDAPPHSAEKPPPTPSAHALPTSRPGPPGVRGLLPPCHNGRAASGVPLSGRRSPRSASTGGGGPGPSSGRRTTVPRTRPSRSVRRGGRTRR